MFNPEVAAKDFTYTVHYQLSLLLLKLLGQDPLQGAILNTRSFILKTLKDWSLLCPPTAVLAFLLV